MRSAIALKIGVVLAGYVLALLVACVTVYIRVLLTQGDMAQASAGMCAFGDVLCFAAVFGMLSLVPTGLALCFLRSFKSLWTALSVAALALALLGPVAATMLQPYQADSMIAAHVWLGQVLGAPLLALGFLVGAVLGPTPRARWMMFAAALIEGLVSAYVFLCLFVLQHWL